MDRLKAKSKMFEEMGEFADGAHADELRAKYAPEPEVEQVPGTEEVGEGEVSEEGLMPEEDVEALLAQLTPEQLEELFSK